MTKKVSSRACALAVTAALVCCALPITLAVAQGNTSGSYEGSEAQVNHAASGTFASNQDACWTLDETGTLTITGEGATSQDDGLYAVGSSVKNIVISGGISAIGEDSFSFFPNLANVEFQESSKLSRVEKGAFGNDESLKSIDLPATVTSIGNRAFGSCYALKSVSFGGADSQLSIIGASAFNGCESLENIEFPASLKIIGPYAFTSCFALSKVSLPAGVESVGQGAFEDCTGLSELSTETLANIDLAPDAFSGTSYADVPQQIKGDDSGNESSSKAKKPRVKIKKLKAKGKHRLAVTWTKISGASKYVIHYKKTSKGHWKRLGVSNKAHSKTIKRLKKGKRYKVYVVAKKSGKTLCKSKVKRSRKLK